MREEGGGNGGGGVEGEGFLNYRGPVSSLQRSQHPPKIKLHPSLGKHRGHRAALLDKRAQRHYVFQADRLARRRQAYNCADIHAKKCYNENRAKKKREHTATQTILGRLHGPVDEARRARLLQLARQRTRCAGCGCGDVATGAAQQSGRWLPCNPRARPAASRRAERVDPPRRNCEVDQ